MNSRLYRLIEVHQRIDRDLRLEQMRRLPDSFRLMRLKRLKLRVKDMIYRFKMREARA